MKNTYNLFTKIAAVALISSFGVMSVYAASLTSLSDTLSSAKINTVSNHDFSFVTPTGVASGQTIIITFPSDFSIPAGLTYADVDVSDDGAQINLAASPSGATAGVVRTSATVLTFTNGTTAVAGGSVIRIKIGTNATNQSTGTFQITNATTIGSKAIGITGTFTDTGTTTVQLITNDTVTVSATVDQSITFSISSNSINFGTLSSGAARYASSTNAAGDSVDTVAHNLQVSTNAPSGYTITVQGGWLTSQQNASNLITANVTPATSSTGSEQFGIYATKSGGVNGTIAASYATASTFGYTATTTTAATFASGTTSTNTETYALHYIANVAATTEAGTYSTGLVYVGTANF
jgi:hypothetical protein